MLIAAPMSALAPLLAVSLMREPLGLTPDLDRLSVGTLTQLAMANAACSALLHSLAFLWLNDYRTDPADILIMMIGDLIGTLVVLYVIKLTLVVLRR